MMRRNLRSSLTLSLLLLPLSDLMGQPDMVGGYPPRLMTRGKLWSTFRNNGLQDGGNRAHYSNHDQTGLEYPGNVGRVANDFMEYWFDVAAIVAGDPNILDVARVCNPQNTKGSGIWVLTVRDGADTLVSYSGPREVTEDVKARIYSVRSGAEASLGDSTGPNLVRSNYSPYHYSVANEPIEIHNYRYGRYIPDDEFPEEIIISQWTNKMDMTVTRKAYSWSYPDYDDFILEELIFENTGSHDLQETFFVFMNSFSVSSAGHQWPGSGGMSWSDWRVNRLSAQDDRFWYTGAPNYVADNPESTDVYKELIFAYQRDDDWLGSSWDDSGQPFRQDVANMTSYNQFQGQVEGQLMGYQYIGFGLIDIWPPFINDPAESYVAPKQEDQPYAEKWWHNGNIDEHDFDEPSFTRHTDTEMYTMITDLSAGSTVDNPDSSGLVTHALVIGPYDLSPGQKAKVVVAYAAGSGADWHDMDELTWSQTKGARAQLKDGEKSIVRNFRRAVFAYEMGFDLPDPPPDVEVSFGNSALGEVRLTWSDAADGATDPDYSGDEARDVRGYRVYRSWPPSFDWHYGPWEFVTDIPVGDPNYYSAENHTYSYSDDASFAGYNYFYSVRSYDSGHDSWIDQFGTDHGAVPPLESGYASPEQKNMIAITPYQPSSPDFDTMAEKIRVVPNPFRLDFQDDLHRYPDTADPYKIRFINLPRHCMIRIYSTSGDLVYEKEHNVKRSGETAWRQDTISFSGLVVSGIYFWLVESLMDESRGEIQKGTLAVVR